MIPLGNIIIGMRKDKTDWRDPVNWLIATVSMQTVCSLPLMTPP